MHVNFIAEINSIPDAINKPLTACMSALAHAFKFFHTCSLVFQSFMILTCVLYYVSMFQEAKLQ
jgi:hypothetical protein